MKETKKGVISIFIANLAKYSAGELVVKWVTLPVEEDELQTVFNGVGAIFYLSLRRRGIRAVNSLYNAIGNDRYSSIAEGRQGAPI